MTSVVVADNTNLYNIAVQEENTVLNITISGGSIGGGGVTDHNELFNKGVNTHAQLDTEANASASHRAETDIHRRAEDIDHGELLNSGLLYTHAQIENYMDYEDIINSLSTVNLSSGATSFQANSKYISIYGHASGNSITTITPANKVLEITLKFNDSNITISKNSTNDPNTIHMKTTANPSQNTVLTLFHDGNKWFEKARSEN